ncbi:putative Ig domain-containing protein [Microvirga sp. VF16]|uniref:putative Ig domain-containing protein n=1 Tax=Microvirga sp. VF16 TaxID=2807101 RepID=UPI00193CB5F6|nr:putative Ig domain-containing protein [Microvirga sp. VF16]QRM33119.1 cadherin domain-containing protein [Microvirga sp. VF16]
MTGMLTAGDLQALETGIDQVLAKIESALALKVYAEDIPIVGDRLKAAFDQGEQALHTITALKDSITGAIHELANAQTYVEEAVEAKINEAMAKAGFVDAAVDTVINGGQVTLAFTTDKIISYTQSLATDFGLAGLGLNAQTTGVAQAEVSYSFDFTVGVDGTTPDSFFLQTNGGSPELALGLSVATPGLAANATLGFLNFDAVDQGSSLSGSFAVDIKDGDGKLRLSELGNDVLDARVSGNANLDLHLSSDMGAASLPKMSTDLAVAWAFSANLVNPTDTNSNFGSVPTVAFNNVQYDFGTFVEDFIRPILDQLDLVLQPIHQALAVFKTDLTFLKVVPDWQNLLDKAGKTEGGHDVGDDKITLLDFVKLANPDQHLSPALQFIQIVDDIIQWAEFFQGKDFGADAYDLGSFQILADVRDAAFELSKAIPTITGAADLSSFLAGLSTGGFGAQNPQTGETGQQILQDMFSGSSFAFPILKNPMEAFRLLLGGNASLFSLDLPALNIGFGDFDSYGNPSGGLVNLGAYPIIPGINVKFSGALELAIDMAFGYDTRGLLQFVQGGFQDYAAILNGFYVSDQVVDGVDLPELTLSAAVELAIEATIYLASIGGGGNIAGQILLNLNDHVNGSPNDGRIYLDEMAHALLTNPFAIFDASGQITAGFAAYVNVAGWDVWRYNSPRIVVGSFTVSDNPTVDVAGAPPPPPGLADLIDGALVLNIGGRASERDISDHLDGSESVQIGNGPGGVTVVGFGHSERVGDVLGIVGSGGAGDDAIVLAEDLNVSATLSGGDGGDLLYGGAAGDSIDGGAERDFIEGRGGGDTLLGGTGDDVLTGGAGADSLDGGAGIDIVSYATSQEGVVVDLAADANHGGDAEGDTFANIEIIEGSRLSDLMTGGTGVDIFVGLDGNDSLTGGDNNDVFVGSTGNDTLDGGVGYDVMYGGLGDDVYVVDSQSDVVKENGDGQASGRDRVVASIDYSLSGSSDRADIEELELVGDARRGTGNALDNLIVGTAADDTLDGAAGADDLRGGAGNDLYIFDGLGDRVVEDAGTMSGMDTIIYDGSQADPFALSIDNAWGANIENLWAKSTAGLVELTGNAQGNVLIGNGLGGNISGRDGDDIIRPGGATSGTYSGEEGNDRFELGTVTMNSRSTFDGGEGADTLSASFAGSEFRAYFYLYFDPSDGTLREELYQNSDGFESTRISLRGIESLTLTGSATGDFFSGTVGNNNYFGGDGRDDFLSVKNRTGHFFSGGGGSYDAMLAETGGTDVYDGGRGWDSIALEISDAAVDFSLRQAQTTDIVLGTGQNSTTIRNIEDISLVTGAAVDRFDLRGANLLARTSTDTYSTGLQSTYYAGGGNDILEIDDTGISAQATYIHGNVTFDGEDGTDRAVIDFSQFRVRVSTTGAGSDYGSVSLSDHYLDGSNPGTVSFSLGLRNIENVTLISGNEVDYLQDLGSNERISAGGGDDFVSSSIGNDTLDGGAGFDELDLQINTSGEGFSIVWADQLAGPVKIAGSDRTVTMEGFERLKLATTDGNDTLDVRGTTPRGMSFSGGNGNDTFKADLDDAEARHAFSGGEGTDTLVIDGRGLSTAVYVSHSLYLDSQTGKATTWGFGNVSIGQDWFQPRLEFSSVETIITYGGSAGDSFAIFSADDQIIEATGGGQDVVNAFIDYGLSENVEELWLFGIDARNGTGNAADNVIAESIASNRLVGGGGRDTFVININEVLWTGSAVTAIQTDEILDFSGDDSLLLKNYNGWNFSGLVEGARASVALGEIAVSDLGDGRTALRWGVDEVAGYDKELILSGSYTTADFIAAASGYNQTLLQLKPGPDTGDQPVDTTPPVPSIALPDITIQEDAPVNFYIPPGAFSDGGPLTYTIALEDGSPLPYWFSRDPVYGQFTFTPPANYNGSINLTVTATDSAGLSASDTFTFTVAPVNDAPTNLYQVGGVVAESSANGTTVSTLYAIDADMLDPAGETLTYSLVDDAGGRFAIQGHKIVVANGAVLDYEQAASHNVTVRVTDSAGATFDEVLTLSLSDVFEAPPTPPVVVVSSSYVLPADGKDITATGSAPVSLTGNAAANAIKGNTGKNTIKGDAGNDVLSGKLGNDSLYGGRDKDAFVFDTKANKTTNVDRIVDFNVSDDSVWLDNVVFKALGSKGTLTKPAQLSAKMFWSGTKAHDKDDRVIYDKKSGALYYDVDGTGSAAQVKIATLSKNLKMTYKDFFVI